MKIVIWAVDKDGDGTVLQVGTYESVYDIRIPVGHFAPDIVLTFEEDMDEVRDVHAKLKGYENNANQ